VRLPRTTLLGVLLYVSLDLSMPMMPGAFVFDAGGSVESLQTPRGRLAAEIVPTLLRDSSLVSRPRLEADDGRPAPRREVTLFDRPAVRGLPRAALDPPQSSEDPH
jgi:hypothetical protein